MRDLSKPLASSYGDPKKSKKKKNSTYSTSGSMYGDDQKVYSRTSNYKNKTKKMGNREYGTLKSEDFSNRSTGAVSKTKAGRLGVKNIDYKPNAVGGGFTKTVTKKNRITGTTSVRTRNTNNKAGKIRKDTQRKMNRIKKRSKGE